MTEAALDSTTEIGLQDESRQPRARAASSSATPLFRGATFAAALLVLLLLGGVILSLIIGSVPALKAFGLDFLTTQSWNPVTEKFGALAPIYGTVVTSLIAMLIGIPVSLRHRHLPDRALPLFAAPADRHRDRAARRHSLDHLRHLGPLRLRAVPAGDPAALADRHSSPRSRACRPCSPARPTASACSPPA